jgi:hypothetical protein
MIVIHPEEQKIHIKLDKLSINIDPILIRTFVSLSKSIKKQEKVDFFFDFFFFFIFLFRQIQMKKKKKLIVKQSLILNHLKIQHFGIFKVISFVSL